MNLTVETVSSINRLEELRDEWNSLLRRSPSEHFALTNEWLCAWWPSFGEGRKLRVVTMRRNGELVCIAPLSQSKVSLLDRWRLGPSLKRLGSVHNASVPLCDFVSANNDHTAVRLLWEHVWRDSNAWDFFEVAPMPMLSPSLIELERIARAAGFRIGLHELAPCPFVDTTGTWERYLGTRSSNTRDHLGKVEKIAAEKGGVDLFWINDSTELKRYLPLAFQMESSRWNGKAGNAMAHDPKAISFHTAFASLAASNGWLRLGFLKWRQTGEPIACQYGVMLDGVLYSEKTGYLDRWSFVAPGRLVQKLILEECFREPVRRCVYKPPPNLFKSVFTTGLERRFRLRIYNRNLKGFILFVADCVLTPPFRKLQAAVAQSRSLGEFWKRVVTAFRDNVFDVEPFLIYEKDLRSIEPVNPKVAGVSFHVASADEIYALATDPEYEFSRDYALRIPELARRDDVCIAGRIENKIVFSLWLTFKVRWLSRGKVLNLAGEKPFIFNCRTLASYRGKSIYPGGLIYAYGYLKSRGLHKCYVDVSRRNTASIRGIEKSGAKLAGRFHILKILGQKRAFVPRQLLKRVSVAPYWYS